MKKASRESLFRSSLYRPISGRVLFAGLVAFLSSVSFSGHAQGVNKIITTVSVGGYVGGIAISPDSKRVYVSTLGQGIYVIDTATNQVGATQLAGGDGPQQMVFTPKGKALYIADSAVTPGDGMISVISDPAALPGAFSDIIPSLGDNPLAIAITKDGKMIYAPDFQSGLVTVIDTSGNQVLPVQLQAGNGPVGVAFTPDGKYAYIANYYDGTVTVIATTTQNVVATIGVGNYPENVVITPNGKQAYVTISDGTVAVIATATNTVTTSIPLVTSIDDYITGLQSAITPDGKYLYVPITYPAEVVEVSTHTNTVVGTITINSGALRFVAITPDGKLAYVAGYTGYVTVINIAGS